MTFTPSPIFSEILDWSRQFSDANAPTMVDGEYYDLPGPVYSSARLKLDSGGRLEVNLTFPQVQDKFSWIAEITIDDAAEGTYKHVLLQTDGDIVETYGKQVIDVSDMQAAKILESMKRLATQSQD